MHILLRTPLSISVYAKHQRPIQHEIYLLKKADIIKSEIFDSVKTFIEVNTISTKSIACGNISEKCAKIL
jgi:type III secretory pathway lipoprotein EscJ